MIFSLFEFEADVAYYVCYRCNTILFFLYINLVANCCCTNLTTGRNSLIIVFIHLIVIIGNLRSYLIIINEENHIPLFFLYINSLFLFTTSCQS